MKGIAERLGRGKGLGWLGPVLLFVLLAGLGMPERAIGLAAPPSASHDDDRAVRKVAYPVAEAQQRCCAAATVLPRQQPRILPRTRSVTEAGLPQPRAPTGPTAS